MASSIVSHIEEIDLVRRFSRIGHCARLLVQAGLFLDDFQVPVTDPIKRANLARYWRAGCYDPVAKCSYEQAREIMGKNCLGMGEVLARFASISPKMSYDKIPQVPFPEIVLQECKDTHVLMLGIPVTIEQISTVSEMLHITVHSKLRKYDSGLACVVHTIVRPGWHLIGKEAFNLFPEDRPVQDSYLSPNEERPNAAEIVFLVVLYRLIHGEQLYFRQLVGCSDQLTEGHTAVLSSISNTINVAQTSCHNGRPRLVKAIKP